jgi:DNA-binding FadR family transcriptional regulator
MLRDRGLDLGGGRRLHVPKTSEIIANMIRAQIVRGEKKDGDALPPEGQLMEDLGISRPTLREAFRILEAEGLISVVRGSRTGAKVHRPSVDLVSRYAGYVLESQGTTISELFEARLAIEPTVVRWLAGERNVVARIAPLKEVLEKLRALQQQERYDDFIDMVEAFHQALVAASGNKVLNFMNRMLLNLARKHQKEYQTRHPRTQEERAKSTRTALKSYAKLLALIEASAVEDAVAHWRLHLRNAQATWAGPGEGERIVDSLGS